MQRLTIGILALVLLSAAGLLAIFASGSEPLAPYMAVCFRLGVVLAVLWLALPDTRPLKNRLLIVGIILVSVAFVARPRLVLLPLKYWSVTLPALAGLGLLAFLRPRRNPRQTGARTGRAARLPKDRTARGQ